jgi:lipopolysaccharide/colanic/teichoic acid biosynthesis glycosyltransferase
VLARFFDASGIALSFFITISLWYPLIHKDADAPRTFMDHFPLMFILSICWFASSYWINLYKKDLLSYGRAVVNAITTLFLSATLTYFIGIFAYSRGVLLLSALLLLIYVCGWRITIHLLYRYRKVNLDHRSPLFTRRAAIVGDDIESQRIANVLKNSIESDFNLIGYLGRSIGNSKLICLGHNEDVSRIIKHHNINELIIPENYLSIKELISIIRNISGQNTTFKIVPSGSHLLIGKGVVENLSGITLVNLELPIFDKIHLIAKRFFDICFSFLLILLFLPLIIVISYSSGIKKKSIWCEDGKKIVLMQLKTSVNWIRELPYLFSILQGKLSFVGCEIVDINCDNPELLFKPGLTGLSQLRAAGTNNVRESDIDHFYLQNQSLVFDLEIIFKSILKV